jgi:DNA-binding winged helix-turn-helix (wHTH) protein/tetratricopeptide (TPR) repeat protein
VPASNDSIDLRTAPITVGDCLVHMDSGLVVRGDDQATVTPRSLAVLAYLIEHANDVVLTADLLARFWRGEITPKNAAHKSITELRLALGDAPKRPTYIETIPKRGYRLVASVQSMKRSSVAVGPFLLLSNDPLANEWAKGLVEAIRHALASIDELKLVPTESASEYVLDGTVESSEDTFRVSVRFQNVRTATQLYSDRFAGESSALAKLQDTMTGAMTDVLRILLTESRHADMIASGTKEPRAYLALSQADYLHQLANPHALQRAAQLLRKAIALDPDYQGAYVRLATALRFLRWYSPDKKELILQELDQVADALQARAPGSHAVLMVAATRNCVGGKIAAQDAALYDLLASGAQSSSAFNSYSRLLAGARVIDAAALYLQRAQALAPDEIVWVRQAPELVLVRDGVEPSLELRRSYVAHDPGDVGHASALAMQSAKLGRTAEAEAYLRQVRRHDKPNIWSRTTEYFMRAAQGQMPIGSPVLGEFLMDKRWFGLVQGEVMFILGDVETGTKNWRAMTGNELNVLSINLPSMEFMFADNVVDDPRYQEMLDDIGLGTEWRDFLKRRVAALAPATGLRPSDP